MKDMIKVRFRNHRSQNGYTISADGRVLNGTGRTILRPHSTRTYGGKLATGQFVESSRTRGILTRAGLLV